MLSLRALVASLDQVQAYSSTVDGLSTLAMADLNRLLGSLDGQPAPYVRDALLDGLYPALEPYGLAVGDVAADYYSTQRAAAGVTTAFRSTPAAMPSAERVGSLVRWGVKPLFEQTQVAMLTLLAGGMQRIIADVGRNTITENAARETSQTGIQIGYRRVPAKGCCAFCAMCSLNTYGSKEAAISVVGRGTAFRSSINRGRPAKGVRPRGTQSLGHRFHDFCRCVTEPVWSDSDSEFAQSSRYQEYEDAYGDAYSEGRNTKEYLSAMRQILGAR